MSNESPPTEEKLTTNDGSASQLWVGMNDNSIDIAAPRSPPANATSNALPFDDFTSASIAAYRSRLAAKTQQSHNNTGKPSVVSNSNGNSGGGSGGNKNKTRSDIDDSNVIIRGGVIRKRAASENLHSTKQATMAAAARNFYPFRGNAAPLNANSTNIGPMGSAMQALAKCRNSGGTVALLANNAASTANSQSLNSIVNNNDNSNNIDGNANDNPLQSLFHIPLSNKPNRRANLAMENGVNSHSKPSRTLQNGTHIHSNESNFADVILSELDASRQNGAGAPMILPSMRGKPLTESSPQHNQITAQQSTSTSSDRTVDPHLVESEATEEIAFDEDNHSDTNTVQSLSAGYRYTMNPSDDAEANFTKPTAIRFHTTHTQTQTYLQKRLLYLINNCTDEELLTYVQWKAQYDVQPLRTWLRIVANTITCSIEEESLLIAEWEQHLCLGAEEHSATAHSVEPPTVPMAELEDTPPPPETNLESDDELDLEEPSTGDTTVTAVSIPLQNTLPPPVKSPLPPLSSHKQDPSTTTTTVSTVPLALAVDASLETRAISTASVQTNTSDNIELGTDIEIDFEEESTPDITGSTMAALEASGNLQKLHRSKSQTYMTHLLDLPDEWLMFLVQNYFNFEDLLLRLPLVCKKFRLLAAQPTCWRSIRLTLKVIRNIHNTPQTFRKFLIRSCTYLTTITIQGSIDQQEWDAWLHVIRILANHSNRQVKLTQRQGENCFDTINNKQSGELLLGSMSRVASVDELEGPGVIEHRPYSSSHRQSVIDTLYIRCRHISRRGPDWLDALTRITTVRHVHCAALSRADDVKKMLEKFTQLQTLNVNVLGPAHQSRHFDQRHERSLKDILELIPATVTEFAIPVSVEESFVRECFTKMPNLENLDFFRLTTPHQNVEVNSWACCLSAESIIHLSQCCPQLRKCQMFVKTFRPHSDTWTAIKILLEKCPDIRMLTIGMEQSATFDTAEQTMSIDRQYRKYFETLKKVDWLRARFRKFKKKTMKFPKFSIIWCLLT